MFYTSTLPIYHHVNVLPFVLHTGHQKSEQIEGQEDPQAEQHSHHIHLSCGEKGDAPKPHHTDVASGWPLGTTYI